MVFMDSLQFSNASMEKPDSLKEEYIFFAKKKDATDFPLRSAFKIPSCPLPQISASLK